MAALAASVGHVPLAEAQAPAHAVEAVSNVRTFGAVGDGKTIDTPAINKAIAAVAAAGAAVMGGARIRRTEWRSRSWRRSLYGQTPAELDHAGHHDRD